MNISEIVKRNDKDRVGSNMFLAVALMLDGGAITIAVTERGWSYFVLIVVAVVTWAALSYKFGGDGK